MLRYGCTNALGCQTLMLPGYSCFHLKVETCIVRLFLFPLPSRTRLVKLWMFLFQYALPLSVFPFGCRCFPMIHIVGVPIWKQMLALQVETFKISGYECFPLESSNVFCQAIGVPICSMSLIYFHSVPIRMHMLSYTHCRCSHL